MQNDIKDSIVDWPESDKLVFDGNIIEKTNIRANDLDERIEWTDNRMISCEVHSNNMSEFSFNSNAWQSVEWTKADIYQSTIEDTVFENCKLTGLHARDLGLSDWRNIDSDCVDCKFEKVRIETMLFEQSQLNSVTFKNCEIEDFTITNCSFENCTFESISTTKVKWKNVHLKNCNLTTVNMSDMKLTDWNGAGLTIDGDAALEAALKSR